MMLESVKFTVKLLSIASQAAYRIKKDNLIDPTYSEDYQQTLIDIANHGYDITDTIVPIGSKGTGITPLGAMCLKPQDSKSPIIISFRGTKTAGDVFSDIRLGVSGTVDKEFRDSAFDFYQKVRKENPGREIILTGHSLGGHLSHYVGTKAYNTDSELRSDPVVQVRTFNTAPINTTHSSVFNNFQDLSSQFVNYRLSSDVVSDLPLQKYQGNTFVFPCDKNSLAAHPMGAVKSFIPNNIMQQTVGTSTDGSKKHHQLIELTNGILSSYQCRVEGQFFSRFRAGTKNLEKMQETLPEVLDSIKNSDYDNAMLKLSELKEKLDGKISTHLIDTLIKSTETIKLEQQPKFANKTLTENLRKTQSGMKSELQKGRRRIEDNAKEKNNTVEKDGGLSYKM